MTVRRKSLITQARERAKFLEEAIPDTIAAQEAQARALRHTDNLNWQRGSALLRELALELENA